MINYEKEHRRLWNWLADHQEAKKAEYFKHWDRNSIPRELCFACEAALQEANRTDTVEHCRFCPLGGPYIVGCDAWLGGLYEDWQDAVSPKRRQKLARQIANLPWKEKKEGDNETDRCR